MEVLVLLEEEEEDVDELLVLDRLDELVARLLDVVEAELGPTQVFDGLPCRRCFAVGSRLSGFQSHV